VSALARLCLALAYAAIFATLLWHYHWDARNAAHADRPPAPASLRAFTWVYRWLQSASALALVDALLWPGLLPRLVEPSTAGATCGLALSTAGLALFVAAKRELGLDYSPCDDARLPRGIVRRGVYSAVRHPIYAANLLVLLGAAAATGSALLAANWVLLLGCYLASIRLEERSLQAGFPDYRDYQARTWALLPRPAALLRAWRAS
jgi:protein-S-isoprenylcysteine O-methyltransferase Ste14